MRRRVIRALGGVLFAFVAVAGIQLWRAAHHAVGGKSALVMAETKLRAGDLPAAERNLGRAQRSFGAAHADLHSIAPLLAVARALPFVRVQVRGTVALIDAGGLLTSAALRLTAAADAIIRPADPNSPVRHSLTSLTSVHAALVAGLQALDQSIVEVGRLDGYRLVGPLAPARAELAARLPAARAEAARAEAGLRAFLSFAGADGDRRYLVFSQNPDEVRPTGGFLGTYGVLNATQGGLAIARYGDIIPWFNAPEHAHAIVNSADAPVALRIINPPSAQTLANVNAGPDWPTAAQLALDLWAKGGEEPVDGVLSFAPDFLARMVGVLGPVDVSDFGETVTAENLVERIDYHTHHDPAATDVDRKRFATELVRLVLDKLLAAPATKFRALGQAAAKGFDNREAMAWSTDPSVVSVLHSLRWDGAFVGARGDFVASSDFEYAAKNGRALHRTFDHHVELHADGSARVTTTLTVANTAPPDPLNIDSLSYVILYGPRGARLADTSDAQDGEEPPLAGQPGAGYLISALPLGEDHKTVVWDAPKFASLLADGSREFRLTWRVQPDHAGDMMRLRVDLPSGWRWRDSPPSVIAGNGDFSGTWRLTREQLRRK